MVNKGKYLFLILVIVVSFIYISTNICFASNDVRIIIDGEDFQTTPKPFIEKGRTFVPIRFISEKLGAKVDWNDEERLVTITKGNNKVILRIDSLLVIYDGEETKYGLSDVAPKIVEKRTFVPLRLVSNALGVGIEWDQPTRTAYVNSNERSEIIPFFDVKLSVEHGQRISGKTKLSIKIPENYPKDGQDIKYLLVSPETAEGFVVAMGDEIDREYTYLPDIKDKGHKVLAALIYDEDGNFVAGDVAGVNIDVNPKVKITGIKDGDILDTLSIGVDINFLATRVEYEIRNLDKGITTIVGKETPQDPYGIYTWEPKVSDGGNYSIKATVFDTEGNGHESETVNVRIQVEPQITLSGVSHGQTITRPVTLLASRNFDVKNTRFIVKDLYTGKETVIDERPYGGYTWFPGPELEGKKAVLVEVEDSRGIIFRSEPVEVNIKGEPILLLDGIGPNEVLREAKNIKVRSNVEVESVKYIIKNNNSGEEKVIESTSRPYFEEAFKPNKGDDGYWTIKAVAKYKNKEIESEEIPFRVYLGPIYGPVSIVSKDNYINEFIQLASTLALDSWEKTGISASLQVAQSILETGWGRHVPVDKYSGKVSYNLFGIKGKGPKGSVTINTREVYNGISYYVDAEFKAYNNIEESWEDHKRLLIESSRYEPFREVMYNSVQGAWALKRSGYATDPEYATKLIRIIEQYNLQKLDIVKI